MTSIYPSPDSEEFIAESVHLKEAGEAIIAAASDSEVPVRTLIDLKDKGDSILVTMTAYADALLSTDSSDPAFLKAVSEAEEAAVGYQKAEDAFIRAISLHPEAADDPSLADYRKYILDTIEESRHLMSPEEEALAAELQRSGSSAWERLMRAITSSIADKGVTLTELRSLASSPDRAVRRDAYERETGILAEHKTAIAASLNGIKGTVLTLERRRGWKDPLDRSLFASSITRETLDSLIAAIEKSLPAFRDYFRTKAGLLGLDKMDFFDLFAPVGSSHREYSFSEARDIVVSSYSSFSPEMGEFAESAFSRGWIDAEPRKGKAGGAYDTFFPEKGESRVFCNFDGSYDSVATIAHELGHAYHDSIVRDLPPSLSTYPMTLAETASIFAEMLVFDHVLSNAEGDEALLIIESFVQSSAQTIVDIYSRYLFEESVFRRRREGEISADGLSDLMLDAQEKAYGDGLGIKHRYMWAVKSHYYSADFSFYNYPYAFGQLFALSLYSRRREEGFPELYRKVLRSTGMMDAADVAAISGADIADVDFWRAGLSVILDYSRRLESWL